MKIRNLAIPVLGLALSITGLNATAQTNPNQTSTPQTTPRSIQNAQQDSVERMRNQESAQDKSVLRQQQRGIPDTGRAATNPTMRDNTTLDNASQETVKQQSKTVIKDGDTKTQTQTKTKEVTTPSGTTITDSQTKIKTQEAGQAPDRAMIKKRTITTPDGKTIEREYYNDFEVLRDDDNRLYYMDKNGRVYFPDEKEEMGAGELERSDMNRDNKTRDDRDPNNTTRPKQ